MGLKIVSYNNPTLKKTESKMGQELLKIFPELSYGGYNKRGIPNFEWEFIGAKAEDRIRKKYCNKIHTGQ